MLLSIQHDGRKTLAAWDAVTACSFGHQGAHVSFSFAIFMSLPVSPHLNYDNHIHLCVVWYI